MKKSAFIAIFAGTVLSANIQAAAFDPKLVAQKNEYIKDIALNAQSAYGYGRLMLVGATIGTAGLITSPLMMTPITPFTTVGAIMTGLGALGYGPNLWLTFVAVAKLENMSEKYPGLLSKKDKRIMQTGRDVLKTPVLRFIEKKLAIKEAIRDTTKQFINTLKVTGKEEADRKQFIKLLTPSIEGYFRRSIDVIAYTKLKQKHEEAIEKMAKKKGWGLLGKVATRAMKIISKLFFALKPSISNKKQWIKEFEQAFTPEEQKGLRTTTTSLFKKVKSIKQAKFAPRIDELIKLSEKMESSEILKSKNNK